MKQTAMAIYFEDTDEGRIRAQALTGQVTQTGIYRDGSPILTAPDNMSRYLVGDLVFLRRMETGEGLPICLPHPPSFSGADPIIKQGIDQVLRLLEQKIKTVTEYQATLMESTYWKKRWRAWWFNLTQRLDLSTFAQEVERLTKLSPDQWISAATGLKWDDHDIPTANVNVINKPGFYKDARITLGTGTTDSQAIRVDTGAEYSLQDQAYAERNRMLKTGNFINIAGLDSPIIRCPIVRFKLAIDHWVYDAEAAMYPGLQDRVKSVMLAGDNIIRPALRAGVDMLEVD